MSLTELLKSEEAVKLLAEEKSPEGFKAKKGEKGLYDEEGIKFPKSAIGVHNVILVERKNGDMAVLMGKRSEKMAHGGKYSLMGGYLEIGKGHGVNETAVKEASEESEGKVKLNPENSEFISTYMSYRDVYNGACLSIGKVSVIRGKEAAEIEKMAGTKSKDSEVDRYDLFNVDDKLLDNVNEKGGFAYIHEFRSVLMATEKYGKAPELIEASKDLLAEEKSKETYSYKKGENGRYDEGGVKFPKAAVGVHNVIFVKDKDGDMSVLMGQRSDNMAHGGKYSLMGGYLEVGSSHGVKETAVKEASEESDGKIKIDTDKSRLVGVYMDYTDVYNGACASVSQMTVLEGKEAENIRNMVSENASNSEVKGFKLFKVNKDLMKQADKFAYKHELRAVLLGARQLARDEYIKEKQKQVSEYKGKQEMPSVAMLQQQKSR